MYKRILLSLLAVLIVSCTAPAKAQTEKGWPMAIETEKGTVTIYQPHVDAFGGNVLEGRAAASVTSDGGAPVFGAFWFECRVETDRDNRTVSFTDITVPHVQFPEATDEQEAQFSSLLERELQEWDLAMSLDTFLASVETLEKRSQQAEKLNTKPPEIIFMSEPAILISIDGEPQYQKIEDTNLERVINTTFPIVLDKSSDTFYLYGTAVWYATSDLIKGPWKPTDSPPAEVVSLFQTEEDSTDAEPLDPEAIAQLRKARIIVKTTPAELIVTESEPAYTPIVDADLIYVSNTESTILLHVPSQKHFLLISGRWYQSTTLAGPWEFIRSDKLPEAFASIPEDSERGDVLVYIAGTAAAQEALLDAEIPQTAAVKRSEAKLEVTYDGDPNFEKVTGTSVEYAINTGYTVLRVDGKYYACDQGIWFISPNAKGPWIVSDKRPDAVDELPPDSPVYNVKYVYIYDSTPDVVYVGYTPGYMGCYPYHGSVVYGTGYYYHPWVSPYYYYPRPVTWGFHVSYNSYSGWGYGMSWGVGWAHFSYGWAGGGWHGHHYYPSYHSAWHGGFAAGYHAGRHGAWGPGGYHPSHGHRNINRNRVGGGNQRNIYQQGANRTRTLPNRTATNSRAKLGQASGKQNNVFADRNGNVYRKSDNGWQKRDSGKWQKADRSAGSATRSDAAKRRVQSGSRSQKGSSWNRSSGSSLNRESSARKRGQSRSTNSNRSRPKSGSRGTGRSGGGRRRG
jgi:hypothetical protein